MEDAEKGKKLQTHRLRMNDSSIACVVLQSVVLGFYSWRGSVSWVIVLAFLFTTVGFALFFRMFIITGWNLRFKDSSLLVPQLFFAVVTQLVFMVLAPQLSILFLVSILVFYNYAMMSFHPRQFAPTWLSIGALTATALYVVRDSFGYPGNSYSDIAILWLFFIFAFLALTSIGVQFSTLRAKLSEKNVLLQEALEKNQELAIRDELTGSYNRRFFMQMIADEWERSRRTGEIFCLAMFDLDHFKAINDDFGHLTGDAVLTQFCKIVLQQTRGTDRFARYGGEEFVLILPATMPIDAALVAIERIRNAVQKYSWESIAPGLSLTVSTGVTDFRTNDTLEELLGRADKALYKAKSSGRNQIICL